MECELNDASLFLQVIREKRDPRSILREALSNSWDAGATKVKLHINPLSKDTLDLTVEDNGYGIERARFKQFFGLGMSTKKKDQSIGHKGLGTKLYFNSRGVRVETITSAGIGLEAKLEAPLDALREGKLPAFEVKKAAIDLPFKHGTRIQITGIPVNTQSPLLSVDGIVNYLRWHSVAGSARRIFGRPQRKFHVEVIRHHINRPPNSDVVDGHRLPEQPREKAKGPVDPNDYVRTFEPFEFYVKDESGKQLARAEIAGAVVGANSHIVRDRRIKKKFKGVFLCKDYFAIRSINEDVTGNSGEWQSFHVLVNCQSLELTMSREDFVDTGDGTVYSALIRAIRQFMNDALRGKPFEYYGELLEKPGSCAGAAYRGLQECKASWTNSEANNRITFTVLDLSTRRALPDTLAGGPYFEPQEKVGTLLSLQSLLSNSALDPTFNKISEQYRLLSYTPEQNGLVLLQTREGSGDWSSPKFYGVQHTLNVKHVRDASQTKLAGIVCWSIGRTMKLDAIARQASRLSMEGLDVLVIANFMGVQPGDHEESMEAEEISMNTVED